MIKRLKSIARSWARKHLFTYNTLRYRVEFPRILDAFKLIGKQTSVFDGGAGGGQMLRMVYEHGYCAYGFALEYDNNLYAILKDNHRDLSTFSSKQGSLLEIPYNDGAFDCAICTQVLEHIEDHQTAAMELGRVVKDGGYLIISVPHPPEPFHTPGHVREGYTKEDLIELFPNSKYDLLMTGYSMTRPTLERAMLANKLPFRGIYVPLCLIDKETCTSNEQRSHEMPYGITCLFRKKENTRHAQFTR